MDERNAFYNGTLLTLNSSSSDEYIKNIYETWAEHYNKVTGNAGYVAYKTCPPIFHQVLKEVTNNNNMDIRILDAGAGTGLVGKILYDLGYRNIDALDSSQKMLDEAQKMNIYKKTFCAALGEDAIPGIDDDQYDAVICVGSLTIGHVKPIALDEFVRIVKPGGVIGFTLRKDVYNESFNRDIYRETANLGYRAKMEQMVKEKKWKLVQFDEIDYHISMDEMRAKCYSLMYEVL